jgi:hypothetical protein
LDKIVEGVNAHTKWRLFTFNSEEDLVLMTNDGRLFLIDIVLGHVKEKTEFLDFCQDSSENTMIEDAKLDQQFNTLVFRTRGNQFF